MTDARPSRGQARLVSCEEASEAVSARLDGERPSLTGQELDAHLASCATCKDFEAQAAALGRQLQLRPARAVPPGLVAELTPLLASSPRPVLGAIQASLLTCP